MKKGIYLLPNSLTILAMFAGFYSMMSVFKGNFVFAGWALIIAALLDGLDGFVARLTGSTTKFGIELDSLSDVISFGVAPSVLLYNWSLSSYGRTGAAVSFLFLACGALRLARYNVQMGSTEKKYFTGMPIPAASGIMAATVLFYSRFDIEPQRSAFVLALAVICSALMVSTMRFHSQKELQLSRRKPFKLLVGVVIFLVILIMYPAITLFICGMLYLLSGVVEGAFHFSKKHSPALRR